MKTYYVLWVPILSELKIPYFCRNKVTHKLEDSKKLGGYYLEGQMDSSLDITIEYRRTGFIGIWEKIIRKKSSVIKLHKESDILSKGFIQYSCELPDSNLNEIQKGLYGVLNTPFYHFVKEFFHNHTHHHASQDSLLQAYVKTEMVDLRAQYEDITLHYIRQYRDLLVDFNEETPVQMEILKKRINRVRQVKRSIAALGDIITAGNELNGQLGYMDFLLNKVARPYSVPKGLRTEIAKLRSDAQLIINDALTSYNISTAALGIRYGIKGIQLGGWGVVVSCILFGISTYITCSNHSIEDVLERTEQNIIQRDSVNSIRMSDSVRTNLNKVEQRIDILQKEIKKHNKKLQDIVDE